MTIKMTSVNTYYSEDNNKYMLIIKNNINITYLCTAVYIIIVLMMKYITCTNWKYSAVGMVVVYNYI